jgi:methionyl-tRNA synthetase
VINATCNALIFICAILEPFIPSFSAKVYEQMNHKRTEKCEKLFEHLYGHPENMKTLIKPGHKIGQVAPIFKEISDELCETFKKKFGKK